MKYLRHNQTYSTAHTFEQIIITRVLIKKCDCFSCGEDCQYSASTVFTWQSSVWYSFCLELNGKQIPHQVLKKYSKFQVATIEFDVNFLNFQDPAVFERFTGPDFEKNMKTTYGFDFVIKTETTKNYDKKTIQIDETPIFKHCAESEFR